MGPIVIGKDVGVNVNFRLMLLINSPNEILSKWMEIYFLGGYYFRIPLKLIIMVGKSTYFFYSKGEGCFKEEVHLMTPPHACQEMHLFISNLC
jgi:hypothetical protein